MRYKPNAKQTRKFYKLMCKKYNVKIIYTGGWIGKLWKKIVIVPIIKKALKKSGVPGNPEKWLENRVVTVGKYILMNQRIGSSIPYINWMQHQTLVHEITHRIQQKKEGTIDFHAKYFKSQDLRAIFEIEAIRTEMFMSVWNGYTIGTPAQWLASLSDIYGFNKETLRAIEIGIKRIMQQYSEHGRKAIANDIVNEAVRVIKKIKTKK